MRVSLSRKQRPDRLLIVKEIPGIYRGFDGAKARKVDPIIGIGPTPESRIREILERPPATQGCDGVIEAILPTMGTIAGKLQLSL